MTFESFVLSWGGAIIKSSLLLATGCGLFSISTNFVTRQSWLLLPVEVEALPDLQTSLHMFAEHCGDGKGKPGKQLLRIIRRTHGMLNVLQLIANHPSQVNTSMMAIGQCYHDSILRNLFKFYELVGVGVIRSSDATLHPIAREPRLAHFKFVSMVAALANDIHESARYALMRNAGYF